MQLNYIQIWCRTLQPYHSTNWFTNEIVIGRKVCISEYAYTFNLQLFCKFSTRMQSILCNRNYRYEWLFYTNKYRRAAIHIDEQIWNFKSIKFDCIPRIFWLVAHCTNGRLKSACVTINRYMWLRYTFNWKSQSFII